MHPAMTPPHPESSSINVYDLLSCRVRGKAPSDARAAVLQVLEAYLDGKPAQRGKRKITQASRDEAFWSSAFVDSAPTDIWHSELGGLVLARYLAQDRVANEALLARIAESAPEALVLAVRRSELVLRPRSPRRAELESASGRVPAIAELCRILAIFDEAHRERVGDLDAGKTLLASLGPFEFLIHASLYAFEHLVPRSFEAPRFPDERDLQEAWAAINDLLVWKLATAAKASTQLSELDVARAIRSQLSPLLFPSAESRIAPLRMRKAFAETLAAQLELNSFRSRSLEAFGYADEICFVRVGDRLEIVEADPEIRLRWRRDGDRLSRLHGYWLYRALAAFADSELAHVTIGRPENHEDNRLAYIKALRSLLRLQEVYGIADVVTADSGARVDLFRALLSLELMSAFFQRDMLLAFARHEAETGNCLAALTRLTFGGVVEGMQNRFPLTWSDRQAKVEDIVGWTVSAERPGGDSLMAAAILDFWTRDLHEWATRLQGGEKRLQPELHERPVLKMGSQLVQLPWLVGLQNNSTAAINNLRRLGARRGELKAETARIEAGLARLLEMRGFRVALNWHPPQDMEDDPGEVDIVCARDGLVFVIELKSTFLRQSQKDAWLHATSTLRKAGRQVGRKVEAVRRALGEGVELCTVLGLAPGMPSMLHGWIVDTSIEADHQRFGGFLKLSLEELLIALRDDRHLLNDPGDILAGASVTGEGTLYPHGFSAMRLLEVIEREEVWAGA